jgi:hypothetical protein
LVLAKRLIVTPRPSIDKLKALEFDDREKEIFGTFGNGTVYTAVLKTNLIPDNTTISFTIPANSTGSPRTYRYGLTWYG